MTQLSFETGPKESVGILGGRILFAPTSCTGAVLHPQLLPPFFTVLTLTFDLLAVAIREPFVFCLDLTDGFVLVDGLVLVLVDGLVLVLVDGLVLVLVDGFVLVLVDGFVLVLVDVFVLVLVDGFVLVLVVVVVDVFLTVLVGICIY